MFVVDISGTIYCKGKNNLCQLGSRAFGEEAAEFVNFSERVGLRSPLQISIGHSSTCVLQSSRDAIFFGHSFPVADHPEIAASIKQNGKDNPGVEPFNIVGHGDFAHVRVKRIFVGFRAMIVVQKNGKVIDFGKTSMQTKVSPMPKMAIFGDSLAFIDKDNKPQVKQLFGMSGVSAFFDIKLLTKSPQRKFKFAAGKNDLIIFADDSRFKMMAYKMNIYFFGLEYYLAPFGCEYYREGDYSSRYLTPKQISCMGNNHGVFIIDNRGEAFSVPQFGEARKLNIPKYSRQIVAKYNGGFHAVLRDGTLV